jgi:hypothetical protein
MLLVFAAYSFRFLLSIGGGCKQGCLAEWFAAESRDLPPPVQEAELVEKEEPLARIQTLEEEARFSD